MSVRRSCWIEEGGGRKRGNRLSSREVEVLQLIAEGHPDKEIAAELAVGTMGKHRQQFMGKLNIHTRIVQNPSVLPSV